ncbi:MAG: hypothetical protein A2V88_15815 [Elusimicrobia bacterium RBG_16_66_12]|nr:MAG: hypothetical protein A2V88_15815 [Elusimicrobia bacterium RBG_16_66_12]
MAALGVSGILLALPVSWPGFSAWQYQTQTLTPGDAAGQDFVLELDQPWLLEFPAAGVLAPEDGAPPTTAEVSVLSSPGLPPLGLPVRFDAKRSRLQVPLQGISAKAGSLVRVVLRDPGRSTWIWATEHDSYLPGQRSIGGNLVGGDLAFRIIYRRRLVDLCLEGLGVGIRSGGLLLASAAMIGASGLLLSGLLRRYTELDLAALVSSMIGGGLLTTAMLGLNAAVLRLHLSAGVVAAATIGLAIAGVGLWLKPRPSLPPLDVRAVGFLFGLVLLGLLNLSFASETALPPHFDSMLHFSLVTDLLAPERVPIAANTVADLFAGYYHLGFHGMAAWILSLSGGFTPISLAVLGQLLQTALLACVYLLVYLAVRDARAALGAFVLAAIGWSMPAYASNWAKYPALLGLAVFATGAGVAIVALNARGARRYGLSVVVGLMAIGAGLVHTRTLFLFAAFAFSVWLAHCLYTLLDSPTVFVRRILPIGVILGTLLAALLIPYPGYLDPVQRSLATLVEGQGLVSTLLVLGLAPFAYRAHRRAAVTAMLFAITIMVLQLLPPDGSYPFPLVDEPMAKMVLFVPMSCLGGLGLAGLASSIRSATYPSTVRSIFAGIIVCLGVAYLARSLAVRDYAPGECCLMAHEDDLTIALAASSRLSPESLTLVPGVAGEDAGPRPIDGGAWLFPLARRRTMVGRADADLRSSAEHARLCAEGVTHLYVGGSPLSYSRTLLDLAPDEYAPVEVLPGAAVYAIIGCGPPG